MANQELNIQLKLRDEYTAKMAKVQTQMQNLSKVMKRAQGEISQVSSQLMFMGAAITGPFALALRNSAKYSLEVHRATDKMSDSLAILQKNLAVSVLPIFNTMIDKLNTFIAWFEKLPDSTKNTILQFTFLGGILITLVGVFGRLTAAIVSTLYALVGLSALNPAMAIFLAAVIGLVVFWEKLKGIVTPFLSVLEAAIHTIIGALEELTAEIWGLLRFLANMFSLLFEGVSKLPGPFKKALGNIGDFFKDLSDKFEGFERKQRDFANTNFSEAWRKFSTGASSTADALDNVTSGMKKLKNIFDGLTSGTGQFGKAPYMNFYEGFKKGLYDTTRALSDFGQFGVEIAQKTANAMTTAYSDLFFNVITGKMDDMKKVFASFGEAILRMFSDVLARIMMQLSMRGIAGLFGVQTTGQSIWEMFGLKVAKKHSGGLIKAHSGMYLTPGEVPLIGQTGEYVMSRRGVQAAGIDTLERMNQGKSAGKGVQIIINPVIQAWDVASVMRNKDLIVTTIAEAVRSNSMLREVLRAYV